MFGKDDGRYFFTMRFGFGRGAGLAYDARGKIPGAIPTDSCKGGVVLAFTGKALLHSGPTSLGLEAGVARTWQDGQSYSEGEFEPIFEPKGAFELESEGFERVISVGGQITLFSQKH